MTQAQLSAAIGRIAEMERIFEILTACKDGEAKRGPVFCAMLRRLRRYYEGGQWLRDYALDEAGLLPRELKRGVLSQDGVYDLLTELKG
ncbi:MAG: DUF4298 domain-containing protein [Oscillospiraceae bacterium]|nr:DUF4298 domain-containing protein [Oscillospiraceae bacterium]